VCFSDLVRGQPSTIIPGLGAVPLHHNPPLSDYGNVENASAGAGSSQRKHRHRAIVADDDTALRHLLGDCLRQIGFEVLEVRDGLELMAAIGKLRETFFPDVVVTDINMPNCNGLSALSAIRSMAPSLNAIVITAFPDDLTTEQAKRLGATAILTKPLDLLELQGLALTSCNEDRD